MPIFTAVLWYHADSKPEHPDQAPILLLHGFDSSSLEFRRLWPILEQSLETWAVDLVGWGFSDSGAAKHRNEMKLGPKQKRDHLYSFWQQKVGLDCNSVNVCRIVFTGKHVNNVYVVLHNIQVLTAFHASVHINAYQVTFTWCCKT